MKKTITLLFTIISLSAFAQIETKTLSSFEIKSQYIAAKFAQRDTTKYAIITFQNAKYAQATDIGSLSFFNQSSLDKFKDDLLNSIPYIKQQRTLEWNNSEYRIKSNEVLGLLTVYDKESKYFYLSKKNSEKLLDWLNIIIL